MHVSQCFTIQRCVSVQSITMVSGQRTRKSTQVCKTRTCARTCDGWPNGFASRLASSLKSQSSRRLALGGQTVKQLRRFAYEFELNQSPRKWVAKRNANIVDLRRLASPFVQRIERREHLGTSCNPIEHYDVSKG